MRAVYVSVLTMVLALAIGCSGSQSEGNGQPVLTDNTMLGPTGSMTPSQVKMPDDARLFGISWVWDEEATKSSPLNASADRDEFLGFCFLLRNQRPECFAKDEGWMFENAGSQNGSELIRNEQMELKLIDWYHIAFKRGKYWEIYRATDWE